MSRLSDWKAKLDTPEARAALDDARTRFNNILASSSRFMRERVHTRARTAEADGHAPGGAATPEDRGRRSARLRTAAASASMLAAASVEALREKLGYRRVSPTECANSCVELLSDVVQTPLKGYYCEGMFTLELEPPYPDAPVLVLLHGYGSGSGLWLANLDDLAAKFHVYAVDWLGCGASERPQFAAQSVDEGERFFTESLHAWMRAQGIAATTTDQAQPGHRRRPIVLAGHSLGGYLTAAFALHHPASADHLVLVSPAGIPEPPPVDVLAQRRAHWLMGMLQYAWESNVTPQSIVRALGGWGEKWASDAITRRFRGMLARNGLEDRLDKTKLAKYLYLITAADGSGEFALNVLLSFGAHARAPMGPRLLAAAREGEQPEDSEAPLLSEPPQSAHRFRTPVTFIYGGTHDWMPADAGAATAAGLRAAGVDAVCALTPASGHHLYLEQPQAFASLVLRRTQKLWDTGRTPSRAPPK